MKVVCVEFFATLAVWALSVFDPSKVLETVESPCASRLDDLQQMLLCLGDPPLLSMCCIAINFMEAFVCFPCIAFGSASSREGKVAYGCLEMLNREIENINGNLVSAVYQEVFIYNCPDWYIESSTKPTPPLGGKGVVHT